MSGAERKYVALHKTSPMERARESAGKIMKNPSAICTATSRYQFLPS
jgi:hypothetical protein